MLRPGAHDHRMPVSGSGVGLGWRKEQQLRYGFDQSVVVLSRITNDVQRRREKMYTK